MPPVLAYVFTQLGLTGAFAYASAAGPALLAYSTVAAYATTFVASAGYSRYAKRKAQQAANANLEDRTVPVRGTDAARTIVYGETRVSGVVIYAAVHGGNREKVTLVYALGGHSFDSIQDVWFGDASVGVLDGNGNVPSTSDWSSQREEADVVEWAPTDSALFAIEEDGTILRLVTVAYWSDVSPSADEPYRAQSIVCPQSDFVFNAGNKTIGLSGANDAYYYDKTLTVTYQAERGTSKAYIKKRLGSEADYDLRDVDLETATVADEAPWTSAHKGYEVPRLHVTHIWDDTVYAQGLPPASAIVRGRRCYDPRYDSTYPGGSGTQRVATPSTWVWTRNPAICTADYLMHSLGFGCAASEIDWESVIDAANACDVVDAGRITFLCDGVLSTESSRKANLETLLSSMAGSALWSAGQWHIRAANYEAPGVGVSFNESDLADGNITVQTHIPRSELFNAVRGRFRDPTQLYAITDFPLYESAVYKAQDGAETIFEDIELPMTQDAGMAQRIAKLVLNRTRQAVTFTGTFKLNAYALQPGDTLFLSLARYGWTDKIFRVVDREFVDLSSVRLVLQEEAEAVYDFDFDIDAAVIDPAPNTNLPDPKYVPAPSGVTIISTATSFYSRADGTAVPYVDLTWTAPPPDVFVEVYWKFPAATTWQIITRPAGDTGARIEGVSGGDVLTIYIVNVNQLGARSAVYWIPTFQLDPELPFSGQPVGVYSANLLANASFEYSADKWTPAASVTGVTLTKDPVGWTQMMGPIGNARLQIVSTVTGVGNFALADSDRVAVFAGRRYVGFAGLAPWGVDAYAEIRWFDGADAYLSSAYGPHVIGDSATAPSRNPSALSAYSFDSFVFESAPANARYARLRLVAAGTWTAPDSYGGRYLWIAQPFLGEVPITATTLPPWDAGGSLVSGTGGLVPGAATNGYPKSVQDTTLTFNGWNVFKNQSFSPGYQTSGVYGEQFTAEVDGFAEVAITFGAYVAATDADWWEYYIDMYGIQLPLPGNTAPVTLAQPRIVTTVDTIAPGVRLSRTYNAFFTFPVRAGVGYWAAFHLGRTCIEAPSALTHVTTYKTSVTNPGVGAIKSYIINTTVIKR